MKKNRFKSIHIRKFIEANPTVKPAEIAKKFNTNVQYVYTLKYLKKKKLLASTPSSKPSAKPSPKPSPKPSEPSTEDLMNTIQRLMTIIDYLEGKLRRGYGTPV